jgi:hypothetical protein
VSLLDRVLGRRPEKRVTAMEVIDQPRSIDPTRELAETRRDELERRLAALEETFMAQSRQSNDLQSRLSARHAELERRVTALEAMYDVWSRESEEIDGN